MQAPDASPTRSLLATVLLTLLVGALAALTGVAVVILVPADQSGWVGLALIPFWLVLELFLEILVEVFRVRGKPDRLVLASVVLASFYAGVLLHPIATL